MNTKQFSAIIGEGQFSVFRDFNTNVSVERDSVWGSSAKYEQLLKYSMALYDIFITLNLSNPPFLISSPRYYPGKVLGGLRMLQFSQPRSNSKCKTTPTIILSSELTETPRKGQTGKMEVVVIAELMSVCLDTAEADNFQIFQSAGLLWTLFMFCVQLW